MTEENTDVKQEAEETTSVKSESELPYDISMELFDRIISSLSRVGGKGENLSDLYGTLNITGQTGSKTLYLLKYLALVETNNRKAWLTQDGLIFANSQLEGRRKMIMHRLPKKYRIMLGWIANSNDKQMPANEIRNSILKIFKLTLSKRLLDSTVVAFCNFMSHFEILDYTRGKASRCELTSIGDNLLKEPLLELPEQGELKDQVPLATVKSIGQALPMITKELTGKFPIMIMAQGMKPLDWDIQHEEDWEHVESYLKSLKNRWKNIHMRKSSEPFGTPRENEG